MPPAKHPGRLQHCPPWYRQCSSPGAGKGLPAYRNLSACPLLLLQSKPIHLKGLIQAPSRLFSLAPASFQAIGMAALTGIFSPATDILLLIPFTLFLAFYIFKHISLRVSMLLVKAILSFIPRIFTLIPGI